LATFATNGSVLIASAGFGPSPGINRVTTCFAADVSMPRKISLKTVAALAGPVLFSLSRTPSMLFVIIQVVGWCMARAVPPDHSMSSHL